MKANIEKLIRTSRVFTYEELVKISDENVEVLNRNIDPDRISKKGIFVLTPAMIHHHAFGLPIEPHIRAYVRHRSKIVGLQDLTFDQFKSGKVAA